MLGCSPAVPRSALPHPAYRGTVCSQLSLTSGLCCLQRVPKKLKDRRFRFLASRIAVGAIVQSCCAHFQFMPGRSLFHDVVTYYCTLGFTANGKAGVTNDIYQTRHAAGVIVNLVEGRWGERNSLLESSDPKPFGDVHA